MELARLLERGEISRQEFETVCAELYPAHAGSYLEATTSSAVQEAEVEETVRGDARGSLAWRARTSTWVGIAVALLGLSVVAGVLSTTMTPGSWFSVALTAAPLVLVNLVAGSLWAGALVARHWWSRGLLGATTLIYLFFFIWAVWNSLQNMTADTVAGSASRLAAEQIHSIVWILVHLFGVFPLYIVYAVRDRLRLEDRNEVLTTRAAHLSRRVSRVAGSFFLIVGLTILLFTLAIVLLVSTSASPNTSGLAVLGLLTAALLAVLGTGLVVSGEQIAKGTSPGP